MSTNHHTPIPSSPKQPANAATFNGPLAQLDQAISDIDFEYSNQPEEFLNGQGAFAVPAGTGSTNGHVIQGEGIDKTQRAKLNFTGSGISVTDTPSATEVHLSGVPAPVNENDVVVGGTGGTAGEWVLKTLAEYVTILRSSLDGVYAALGHNHAGVYVPVGGVPVGGWVSDSHNWSFVSADGATGVASVDADLTGVLSKGMRLSYQQSQALTAYWNLDANSNSQVGAFNGTDTAISYAAGKFSNGATFNGTASKIVIADNASLKPIGDFTLGMWFKTSSLTNQNLFQSFAQNTTFYGIKLAISNTGLLDFYIGDGVNVASNRLTSPGAYNDGNWHYFVIAFRNNYGQMYIDGVLVSSGYLVSPVYNATNYVRIGCRSDNGSDGTFMNGSIDDVYLINGYALDEAAIRGLYLNNAAIGTTPLTVTKYGVFTATPVHSGGVTTVTFWGGTDHSLVNAAISNPKYSSAKFPFGFPANPAKWSVVLTDTVTRTSASNTTTWQDLIGNTITAPIGAWYVSYSSPANATKAAGGICQPQTTLSTTTNSETDPSMTVSNGIGTATGYTAQSTLSGKLLVLAAKQAYHFLLRNNPGFTVDSINIYNGVTTITFESAYL